MSAILSDDAKALLAELAAEIVAHGNPGSDLIEEAKLAYERRVKFAEEMRAGMTARSRRAAKALALVVWTRIQNEKNVELFMRDCAEVKA